MQIIYFKVNFKKNVFTLVNLNYSGVDVHGMLMDILDTKVGMTNIQVFKAWNLNVENRSSEGGLWRESSWISNTYFSCIYFQVGKSFSLCYTFETIRSEKGTWVWAFLCGVSAFICLGLVRRWKYLRTKLEECVGKGYPLAAQRASD